MLQPNSSGSAPARRFVPNAPYRVAHDLNGDWWIWRRSSQNSWTTYQRCNSETEAQLICDELIAGGKVQEPSTEIKS
ncbi:MAG: hypothetical protein ED559_06575 [Phycisphaera sp.]|nr:MAG: hypothetical protein ED559_06575 [Phycisphaera sp.]